MAQTKREKKVANRKKMAKKTRKEQHRAGIFKKKTQIKDLHAVRRPPDNNQKLGGLLFGKVKTILYICIMNFEEQIILEAQIYGVLSLVLICGMLWMVFDEKRKYDKTNGRKKK